MIKMFMPSYNGQVFEYMKQRFGVSQTTDIEAADIVMFTGGADVCPLLYGEAVVPGTHIDVKRDMKDVKAWQMARDDAFKIGICRGGQFLNVMNRGQLWQDVDNHAIQGTHPMHCTMTNTEVDVTSTHHQMMIPHMSGQVLGIAPGRSTRRQRWAYTQKDVMQDDVEVVYYEATKSLCYQPHPEYDVKGSTDVHFSMLVNFLFDIPVK